MNWWAIYLRDREYAREMADPLIGHVQAATKEEAERAATRLFAGSFPLGSGPWAVERKGEEAARA